MQGWWQGGRVETCYRLKGKIKLQTLITTLRTHSTASQWLNLFLCLPTFHNDPTKWLNMYIGYCILLTESVFRILRIIHIVRFVHFQSFENIVWMRGGCVRVRLSLHGTFFHQTLSVRKSLQNICINCNYGNMFLPQNVLYTAIYIVHSSFRYDEFQDMRIRCCAMPRPNRKLLWIKCYSRLEPSEVFLLPHYFGIIILTYRSIFSPTHEAAFRMREEKNQNKPPDVHLRAQFDCYWSLTLYIHIDIYEPKKKKKKRNIARC